MNARLEDVGTYALVALALAFGLLGVVISASVLPVMTTFVAIRFGLSIATLIIAAATTLWSWVALWRHRRVFLLGNSAFAASGAAIWAIHDWGVNADLAIIGVCALVALVSLARHRCGCEPAPHHLEEMRAHVSAEPRPIEDSLPTA